MHEIMVHSVGIQKYRNSTGSHEVLSLLKIILSCIISIVKA